MAFLKDSVVGLFWQLSGAAAQFLAGVVLARVLLEEGRGLVGLGVLLASSGMLLAQAGLGTAGMRELAQRPRDGGRIAATVLLGTLLVGGLASVLLVTAWPAFERGLFEQRGAGLLAWIVLGLLAGAVDQAAGSLLTGAGRPVLAQRLRSIQGLLYLGALALAAATERLDPAVALGAWALSNAAIAAATALAVLRLAPAPKRPSAAELGALLRFGLKALPATAAGFLLLRSDLFVVGAYRDLKEVGVYAQASALSLLFQLISRSVERAFAPRILGANAEEAGALVPLVTRTYLLLLAPLSVVAILAAPVLVPLIFGAGFAEAGRLQALLLPGMLIANVGLLCNAALLRAGHPGRGSMAASAALIVNLVLNLWWVPGHGLWGAAWASMVAYGLYGALLMVAYARYSGASAAELLVPRVGDLGRIRSLR